MPTGQPAPPSQGDVLELEVGPVAHGGHCVARHEGRVVFVRHALPGERVRARLTEAGAEQGFWRADAVEVLSASPDRVEPACPVARPGGCGGCDWQHAAPAAQRRLKADVLREQMQRLAGLDVDVPVEEVPLPEGAGTDPGDAARGLGWRTRVAYAADGAGRLGFRAHREHRVVPVESCPIASPGVVDLGLPQQRWPGWRTVEAVVPGGGEGGALVVAVPRPAPGAGAPAAGGPGGGGPGRGGRRPDRRRASGRRPASAPVAEPDLPPLPDGVSVATSPPRGPRQPPGPLHRVSGRSWVREEVAGRAFRVTGSGFWQVHPGAGAVLTDAVLRVLAPRPGETSLDLFSGAGLLTAALAGAVGPTGRVTAVEGDERAVADARRNLHDLAQVRLVLGPVQEVLERGLDEEGAPGADGAPPPIDLVVLDPPRTGARAGVVRAVVARRPRAVAYVACDPAALARDVATFSEEGYELRGLRAFDLFPNTHHLECVALLEPRRPPAADPRR
ncbi:TRAM domain-containing protein [uncultured Pseudokineococcus sp.]|uniref:class I SAM-dependent RNA methyltransferase n=1 Tax=uncultured Pseudokineococcus sp. TaxID=1642928 RepID=UPI00343F062D